MIEFTPHEKKVTSGVAGRKDLYLDNRDVTAQLLVADLVSDAFALNAFPLSVDKWKEWTIVASPVDWITKNLTVSLRASFFSVHVFPEKGREMFRCNIFLATFCEHVVTYSSVGEKEVIKGREDLSDLEQYLSTSHAEKRIVAFSGITNTDQLPEAMA
jgi:hypothetical protein